MSVFRINVYDSEDNSYYSIVNNGIAGEDLLVGDLCYLNTDGKLWKANSSSEETSSTEIRIAKESLEANEEGLFYVQGTVSTSGLTVGVRYYISDTDGEITSNEPGTNLVKRYIGTASATDALEFNPMDIAPSDPIFTSALDNSVVMTDAVGGLDAGTTVAYLNDKTVSWMFDAILFPTEIAYISDTANLSLSGYSTSSVEVGTEYSFTAVINYDPGTINNGNGTVAGNITGDALTFTLTNPDGTDYTEDPVTSNTDIATTAGYTYTDSGSQTWTLSGTNEIGTTTYVDNKGGTDTVASIETAKADTVPNNVTFNKTAYYPLFYGMSASNTVSAGTGLYLNSDLTKNIASTGDRNVSLTGTNEYIYFAYPSSSGSLSSIIDGNGFDVTSSFTVYTVDVTSSGQDTEWTEEYNIYRTTAVTTVSGQTFEFNF